MLDLEPNHPFCGAALGVRLHFSQPAKMTWCSGKVMPRSLFPNDAGIFFPLPIVIHHQNPVKQLTPLNRQCYNT